MLKFTFFFLNKTFRPYTLFYTRIMYINLIENTINKLEFWLRILLGLITLSVQQYFKIILDIAKLDWKYN